MFSFRNNNDKSSANKQTYKGKRTHKGILHYDHLEAKNLLAGITFDAVSGLVSIEGSANSDAANVVLNQGTLIVSLNTGTEVFNQQFNAFDVNEIEVTGLAGDDFFRNDSDISVNAFGNSGDDTLVGGGLLYTSPSPRDKRQSRMLSSA